MAPVVTTSSRRSRSTYVAIEFVDASACEQWFCIRTQRLQSGFQWMLVICVHATLNTDICGVLRCGLRPRATFWWNPCEVIGDAEGIAVSVCAFVCECV